MTNELRNFLSKVELTRGLVQELVKKLRHELNPTNHPTINDDYLFSHLIDELLLFDKELCILHSYPDLYPRCIAVVQDECVLCRWRNVEKQCELTNGSTFNHAGLFVQLVTVKLMIVSLILNPTHCV